MVVVRDQTLRMYRKTVLNVYVSLRTLVQCAHFFCSSTSDIMLVENKELGIQLSLGTVSTRIIPVNRSSAVEQNTNCFCAMRPHSGTALDRTSWSAPAGARGQNALFQDGSPDEPRCSSGIRARADRYLRLLSRRQPRL